MVHVPMVHVPEEQASALQYAGHLQPVRWGLGRPKGERVHLPNMDARGDGAGRRMGLGPSPLSPERWLSGRLFSYGAWESAEVLGASGVAPLLSQVPPRSGSWGRSSGETAAMWPMEPAILKRVDEGEHIFRRFSLYAKS